MKEKLIIGRYIKYDSFVHRLNPKSKLISTILYFIMVFIANNWQTYFLLGMLLLITVLLSKIPLKYFLNGIRPMIWLITFTTFLQILFAPVGSEQFTLGVLSISKEGLKNGGFLFLRFLLLIIMSIILTLTTKPIEMADAIEFILTPLSKLKFPVDEMAMMLSISLRFIPTMFEEAEVIINAQRSRGMDFEKGNIIQKIKNIVPLLLPLFISSYDRAPQLAMAMESRGYQSNKARTRYRKTVWTKWDVLTLSSYSVMLIFIFFITLF